MGKQYRPDVFGLKPHDFQLSDASRPRVEYVKVFAGDNSG